jgi:hypothetical protein
MVGLLLVPLSQHPVMASPNLHPLEQPAGQLNLRLEPASAKRVLADLSGAAQEDDREKPKSMDEQAVPPPAPGSAAAVKKAPPPPDDPFAIVKDWPFWVIVGGVVVVGVAGYMLLRNSNQEGPCAPAFAAGCYGKR